MKEPEKDRFWIVARDKPGLLIAMMRALVGDAHMSFEGDLSRCAFSAELAPSPAETPALARHTSHPRQDFVVVPLEQDKMQAILDTILADGRFMKDIIHIQIEKKGRLEFGSYDNFHPDCVVCFHSISTGLLSRLQKSGVIRSWTEPYVGATRWHG
jgi:hypothetical protein